MRSPGAHDRGPGFLEHRGGGLAHPASIPSTLQYDFKLYIAIEHARIGSKCFANRRIRVPDRLDVRPFHLQVKKAEFCKMIQLFRYMRKQRIKYRQRDLLPDFNCK